MKTELNVVERLTLLGILPKEGSFVTLKVVRELVPKIGFTEEELAEFELKEENGTVKWNIKGSEGKEFEFGAKSVEMISEALKKLNTGNKLTGQHFSLYEKFIGDE